MPCRRFRSPLHSGFSVDSVYRTPLCRCCLQSPPPSVVLVLKYCFSINIIFIFVIIAGNLVLFLCGCCVSFPVCTPFRRCFDPSSAYGEGREDAVEALRYSLVEEVTCAAIDTGGSLLVLPSMWAVCMCFCCCCWCYWTSHGEVPINIPPPPPLPPSAGSLRTPSCIT